MDDLYNSHCLQRIKDNNPLATVLSSEGLFDFLRSMSVDEWEELGRDISNNTHLISIHLSGVLDDYMMTFLFRGLT
eukprot:CAMPEP_0201735914 /NCGR_PEP_ID=MMETSP0593-20130828/38309_1 /ASSEMBLY_ACC=CAM_ASM_000672 /TAXON_ID=267983 /ORGANISM="Skeletonema japonicum, Strain CCMP2506" /LENGTH=75 /DNA_ID=CAMNT_0048229553 /DNA_START=50 /DNA_END=274 /DNA_ORIENTATION=-